MNNTLIKNAKIVNEGTIFEGDVLIEGEFIKEIGENIENEPIKDNDSPSLPPSIGMGASGMSDLSTRCEELLWQDER